jgi:hypothetical protein
MVGPKEPYYLSVPKKFSTKDESTHKAGFVLINLQILNCSNVCKETRVTNKILQTKFMLKLK